MSSEDEDMEYGSRTPDEIIKGANSNVLMLPPASKDKYNKVYDDFQKWNKLNGAPPVSQNVLMAYFSELAVKSKPSTLWVMFSMLKATLRCNDNVDITPWTNLTDYLKKKYVGYKPPKAKVFSKEEIEKFINEAPDDYWLDVKVVCIFGICGAYSARKLVRVMVEHVKEYDDLLLVTVPKTETSPPRSFTITGVFFHVVQKYAALRPANATRFFTHFRDGKCTVQPIGQNKIFKMPRRIAKYLKLTEPDSYSGYSFRITEIAKAGASTVAWNLLNVAKQDIPANTRASTRASTGASTGASTRASTGAHNLPSGAKQITDTPAIQQSHGDIELALDYETGLLITSSNSTTNVRVSAASNMNDTSTEHVCTVSCGQVKCAQQENENSVLHAFSLMKPPDYAITEVAPALFPLEPTCRWIVAYSHFTEPISAYNAEEKFADITRSIPNNVTVVQKYIRWNSSQLFAAYIVVYGVKCRCLKQNFDPHSAKPSDEFRHQIFNPQTTQHSAAQHSTQNTDVFRRQTYDPLSAQHSDGFRKENYDPLSAEGEPSEEFFFSVNELKYEV